MKTYRTAIILLAVLVLVFAGYFFYKDIKANETPDSDETVAKLIRIFDLDSAKIIRIEVIPPTGEKMVFVRKDTEWSASVPSDLVVESSSVNSIAINFSYLSASKIIEEESADLSVYGLDKPVTVIAQMEDGTVKTLEIGNQTPTKGGYYVKEKDSKKVYTIDSYTGDKLNAKKIDLKIKEILALTAADISTFSLERNGEKVFSSEKVGEFDWNMLWPIKGTTNSSALSPMLESVAVLTALEFVDENTSSDLA
ncbi:MAG: DUF4340 domain-containing protein, partial [Clostridiales bacterium]|nr:DUF4340 domain-containing protein [Clostridiales bacterium]